MSNIKNIRLSNIICKDKIIKSLIGFHTFAGSTYISSFYRTGKASCFKIFQASSKFQSKFATLKITGISDDLFTKLEEFVMLLLQYVKKDMNEFRFVKYPSKYENENNIYILTILRCRSELLYHNIGGGRIMLFVSGKEAWNQILNFQVYQITDGTKT